MQHGKKWWLSIQIIEDRKPIDHPWNKEEGEDVKMSKGAKVKYAMGITINLDNFQSARVDVGIELPAEHSVDIDSTYDMAKDFCNDKIMQEMAMLEDLKKAMKKKKG
jgi:hypothetical protein